MDFIMGLLKALNVDTIMVVVDRTTKYGHFLTLRHPFYGCRCSQKIYLGDCQVAQVSSHNSHLSIISEPVLG